MTAAGLWSGRLFCVEVSMLLVLLLLAHAAFAATYYVDCARGSDSASGASPQAAWKTVGKVSAQTFAPGDAILFRRGSRCSGMLWPKGSGESARPMSGAGPWPANPIRIGNYGEGALPVIDGTGQEAAVKLFNQQAWEIQGIETTGGNPHGIHIGADSGRLKHFRVRDVVVRDVTGEVKKKDSGLIAVLASGSATLEDIVIDGARAYNTTQWAGVIVRGASRENRARDVVVRNTVVHDVFGDAIILFQVENGLIEKSAAWLGGLMPRESIGTPNGIWTWRCRKCTVQLTEGFFMDSPGVDGGVYDIDWGNDDNIVQYNYGHDSQGYCASVFGASKEITTNSVIRYNVCVNNGRSPKLARRQGDLFLSTWDGGLIDGLRVDHNTFYWNPPIDAPVVQMDHVDVAGRRPNELRGNLIHSAVPSMIHSGDGFRFDQNLYWYAGGGAPKWRYGGREYEGFDAYRRGSRQDAAGLNADPKLLATMRLDAGSPAIDATTTVAEAGGHDAFAQPVPQGTAPDIGAVEHVPAAPAASALPLDQLPGRWALVSHLGTDELSRGQVVFLQSALEQYGDKGLAVAVAFAGEAPDNVAYDWNLGRIQLVEPLPSASETLPTTSLVAPDGRTVRRWTGLAPPAELGLLLRAILGPPLGSPPVDLPLDETYHHALPAGRGSDSGAPRK